MQYYVAVNDTEKEVTLGSQVTLPPMTAVVITEKEKALISNLPVYLIVNQLGDSRRPVDATHSHVSHPVAGPGDIPKVGRNVQGPGMFVSADDSPGAKSHEGPAHPDIPDLSKLSLGLGRITKGSINPRESTSSGPSPEKVKQLLKRRPDVEEEQI